MYDNRSVIVLQTRFGKVVRERVYEDTQKVAAFDTYLERPRARDRMTFYSAIKAFHIMAAFAAYGLPFAYPFLLPYLHRHHPRPCPASTTIQHRLNKC